MLRAEAAARARDYGAAEAASDGLLVYQPLHAIPAQQGHANGRSQGIQLLPHVGMDLPAGIAALGMVEAEQVLVAGPLPVVQLILDLPQDVQRRSEERRVGKECRSRWS